MKKAIIYRGEFTYNLGDAFANPIAVGLEQLGYEVKWLDLKIPAERDVAADLRTYEGVDLVFALNGIRVCHPESAFRYFRDSGCVFIGSLIDPPLLQYPRLFFNNDILTCIDRGHLRFLQKYFKLESEQRFFPHGGCACPIKNTSGKRPYDIIFAGTYSDPGECLKRVNNQEGRGLKQIFSDAIDILLSTECVPPFEALEQAAAGYNLDFVEQKDIFALMVNRYSLLDSFIRAERRVRCLRVLDEAGLGIDIWGKGWPEGLFRHHRIHPPRSLDEINYLMTRTKICLDLGFYEDGSHERVFSAMRNGSLSVIMENSYHREILEDEVNTVMYRCTRFDEVPGRLQSLLADSDRLDGIAACGMKEAEKCHSWEARAGLLVTYADEYRKQHS